MSPTEFYPVLKVMHVSLALSSFSLFVVRGFLVLSRPGAAALASARRLSYLIDTALLSAAAGLLWVLQINPFITGWLQVKLLLLLAYIVLGSMALKRAKTKQMKALAFLMACACFAAIYRVARSHDPLGFVRLL